MLTSAPRRLPGGPRVRTATTVALFLAPAFLVYAVFVLYPIGNAFVLSFYRWDGISTTRSYVGLRNYRDTFTQDPVFWHALGNTCIWAVLSLLVPTTLGLAFALLLNSRLPLRPVLRSLLYLPAILATVVVAAMWQWMYDPSLGLIDALLNQVGLGGWVQDWLGSERIALYSVFAPSAWQSTGVNMLLFLAGLQGVAQEQVEAARIDGAGSAGVFRYVTVPALRQTFIIVFALTLINALKSFDLVYVMTYGGPGNASQVLATWLYTQAFNAHSFGIGMAIAMVLFVITLVVVVPYLYITSRGD